MLTGVVAEASNSSGSPKNFATKSDNISAFQTLYTLAQCTPDLSSKDCDMCLRDVMGDIPRCCLGKQGVRVLYPSCNLRYELYPFYRSITDSAPAPRPSANTHFPIVPTVGDESATLESLQFNLGIIEAATNKFSQENMIGKGGFGEVYKAWTLWRDETPLEILDPNLKEFHSSTEVTKCIQIGLLCAQENPNARPSMAQVVTYLSSHSVELSFPQEPAFFMNGNSELNMDARESSSGQYFSNKSVPKSVNEISMSTFFPQ
ncbi:hypothetical protein L6164_028629 [Bauhinia variegata]|uniref:Uncharacterized protein n=1 Tax=Bauhinia variegata TaxID=167791 RepID=A0ACB9L6D9_BAUVA|nr:hypothetical protein L6164_028629 [Bauhinia variegata]